MGAPLSEFEAQVALAELIAKLINEEEEEQEDTTKTKVRIRMLRGRG